MDMLLRFNKLTRAGQLVGSVNATYYLKASQQITSESAEVTRLNQLFYLPAFRSRASGAWERAPWALSTSVKLYEALCQRQCGADGSGRCIHDGRCTGEFRSSDPMGGGFRISLSAFNVFDEQPPKVNSPLFPGGAQFGYDAANASPIGRFPDASIVKTMVSALRGAGLLLL